MRITKKEANASFLVLVSVVFVLFVLCRFVLGSRRGGRFANLGNGFLQCWHVGLVRFVGYCDCLRFKIKYQVFYTIFQFLVKRNILQNLIAAVLAVQVDVEHYLLLVWLSFCCTQYKCHWQNRHQKKNDSFHISVV